jgi:hypothetical protein
VSYSSPQFVEGVDNAVSAHCSIGFTGICLFLFLILRVCLKNVIQIEIRVRFRLLHLLHDHSERFFSCKLNLTFTVSLTKCGDLFSLGQDKWGQCGVGK